MDRSQYVIVGAGIAGLTTALFFEQNGIDYQLFESAPALKEVGAGIWLAPNALQVLDKLGLLETITRRGNVIDRISVTNHQFDPLTDIKQTKAIETYGFSTLAIHRAALLKTLAENIPSEKMYFGNSFESFELEEHNKVQCVFNNYSISNLDFIIGADGIHSKIRAQISPNIKERFSGQTCWRGLSDFVLPKEFQSRGIEMWGDQIRFGFSAISPDKVYWFAVKEAPANERDTQGEILQKLTSMFQDFHPMINQIIKASPVIMRNDISDLPPNKSWYKGNVCLIGDAAHATTPNMGQGGAQAIEDAYFLTQSILNNPNEVQFSAFQKSRLNKVNGIVKKSFLTGKIAHLKNGQTIRNSLFKMIPNRLIEKQLMEVYRLS